MSLGLDELSTRPLPILPLRPGRSLLSVIAAVLDELEVQGLELRFDGLRCVDGRCRAELVLWLPTDAPPSARWPAEITLRRVESGCEARPWIGLAEGVFDLHVDELSRLDRAIWDRLDRALGTLSAAAEEPTYRPVTGPPRPALLPAVPPP